MGFPQEGRECQGTPLQPSRKILGGEYPQLRLGRPWLWGTAAWAHQATAQWNLAIPPAGRRSAHRRDCRKPGQSSPMNVGFADSTFTFSWPVLIGLAGA